jgi:hypothetical protein
MLDVQATVITAGVVSVVAAVVQVVSMLQDRKHIRFKDSQSESREPLEHRSAELGLVEQATVIQQRMIDSQAAEVRDLASKNATLISENALLRSQMMDMYLQMREMEKRAGQPPSAPPSVI